MERRTMRTVCPRTRTESASLLLTLVMLLILQLAGQGSALSPPPGSVKVGSMSFGGTGCPPGSTEGAVSDDGNKITLLFTKFIATTHRSAEHRRRSCFISVDLSYPDGFALSLGSTPVKGYAKLDRGVSGSITTGYYFSGQSGTARSTRKLQGPFDENFEFADQLDVAPYSKCGNKVTLSVILEVTVKPGKKAKGGGGIMELQSLPNGWDLVWKQC